MNFDEQFNSYIGVDETGVGDYFTPVVSVACFIPKNNIDEITAHPSLSSENMEQHHTHTPHLLVKVLET